MTMLLELRPFPTSPSPSKQKSTFANGNPSLPLFAQSVGACPQTLQWHFFKRKYTHQGHF